MLLPSSLLLSLLDADVYLHLIFRIVWSFLNIFSYRITVYFYKLGLFTGWEDAPLADEGIEEARIAGRNLKKHGFEFDVVYTSWLSRALETAWYVMDEMDSLWLQTVLSSLGAPHPELATRTQRVEKF